MDSAFAGLLKEHRLAAGLTQEALAERAGLGVRSIQGLEHGESRPLRDTLHRLAAALALSGEERTRFLTASVPAPRRSATASAAVGAPAPAGSAPGVPPAAELHHNR